MAQAPNWYRVVSTHYLPTRAALAPLAIDINGDATRGQPCTLELSYQSVVTILGEKFSGESWSRLRIVFWQPHAGAEADFYSWCDGERGRAKLVDETLRLQNLFIEHVKDTLPFNARLTNLRHFGPSEWPFLSYEVDGRTVFERGNPCLLSSVFAVPLAPELNDLRKARLVPATRRSLLRATDLVDCGYPTEAVLVAFAVLDAAVQDALHAAMRRLGISEEGSSALLRNTTQSRLATYLDPVLKLITGHSMQEDEPSLFSKVGRLNAQRNDAIHRGTDVSRSDAREACRVVYDALDYLNRVGQSAVPIGPRPNFPEP